MWWSWALTGNSLPGLCWGPEDQGQPGEPPDLLLPPTSPGHWGAQRAGATGGPSGRGGDSWGTWGRRCPDSAGLVPFQRFSPNPPSGPTQAPWPPGGARRPSGVRGLCWQMSTVCIRRAALYTGRLRPLGAPGTRPGSTLNTRAQVMLGGINVLTAAGTTGQSRAPP